jgi:hypothetical protein
MPMKTASPTSIASRRYLAIATSPKMKEPRSEAGSGIGMICGPHRA